MLGHVGAVVSRLPRHFSTMRVCPATSISGKGHQHSTLRQVLLVFVVVQRSCAKLFLVLLDVLFLLDVGFDSICTNVWHRGWIIQCALYSIALLTPSLVCVMCIKLACPGLYL